MVPFVTYESGQVDPTRDCHADHAISMLAYELWDQAGRPEGAHPSGKSWADHFWLLAESGLQSSAHMVCRSPHTIAEINPYRDQR
jgi:hypothetical protein